MSQDDNPRNKSGSNVPQLSQSPVPVYAQLPLQQPLLVYAQYPLQQQLVYAQNPTQQPQQVYAEHPPQQQQPVYAVNPPQPLPPPYSKNPPQQQQPVQYYPPQPYSENHAGYITIGTMRWEKKWVIISLFIVTTIAGVIAVALGIGLGVKKNWSPSYIMPV